MTKERRKRSLLLVQNKWKNVVTYRLLVPSRGEVKKQEEIRRGWKTESRKHIANKMTRGKNGCRYNSYGSGCWECGLIGCAINRGD